MLSGLSSIRGHTALSLRPILMLKSALRDVYDFWPKELIVNGLPIRIEESAVVIMIEPRRILRGILKGAME